VRAVPLLCEFYPGICLTNEEKAGKNLSQGKKNLSQVKKNFSQSKGYDMIYEYLLTAVGLSPGGSIHTNNK
jgi:hypothetical protein